ncbi:MAG: hypothetical protein CMJ64_23165 [Planctomycetaceae bacterium]|nr:hypothetical protein [Planctomycetaceae bacterium]
MTNTAGLIRRIILATLVCFTSTAATLAQNNEKPVAVISLASVDELMADIGYLTRAGGSPEYGALVTIMAGQFIQGIDTTQPAGAYITMDGEPSAIVFVAVSDFAAITTKIEESVGELEDIGGGVKKLSLQRAIYLKETDGWVFATDKAANLNNLPKDPTELLGGLDKEYDVAIRLNVQNIPEEIRKTAVSEIKQGFERSIANETDDETRRVQEQFGGRAIESIDEFASEADQLTIGWAIDSEAAKTYLDLSVTALEGTKLASQIGQYSNTTSDYSDFLREDAAATFHFTTPLAKEDVEQMLAMVKVMREEALKEIDKDDDLPNDEARAEAKDIVGALIDVLQSTVEEGKLSGGGSLLLAPGEINFIAGGFIADGQAIKKNLQRLAELAKQAEDAPGVEVKFDVDQHAGVSFHTLKAPVPEDEEEARKILGEEIVVTVGTGAKSIYVGFGDRSAELLKQVIDKSADAAAEETLPMELNIALAPIMAFAASVQDDPIIAGLAEALKNGNGKDRISITGTPIERGVTYRLEVEEDVLQLIGQAAKLQNARDRDPF